MAWFPDGVAVGLRSRAAFALSDVEDSEFPSCRARVGIDARRGWANPQPPRQPFSDTLIAAIRNVVEALAAGRPVDPDGGLARAAKTYTGFHAAIREFLDTATLNYLEFLEAREQIVGPLAYIGYSFFRNVDGDMSMKLWAPVYETETKAREVHRLRYSRAQTIKTEWSSGAAWIVSDSRYSVSVLEVGIGDASKALVLDAAGVQEIADSHDRESLPRLTAIAAGTKPISGSDCLRCVAVSVCPVPIPMHIFPGMRDEIPWVRALSETDLLRYGTCPAKAFIKSHHLPAKGGTSEAANRGIRVHRWIADTHESPLSCADALLVGGTEAEDDLPYLKAHASVCDRAGLTSLGSEQTLVGWDAQIGDVIFMKPDELWMLDNDMLVLREIKTTTNSAALDSDIAWQQFSDVVTWWLVVLRGGLVQHFGATRGQVELEVLTPEGAAVHILSLDDPNLDFRIAGWALGIPSMWLSDRDLHPNPGAHCEQCEVIKWCRAGQS